MPIPDYIRKMRALVGHELIVVVGTSAVICNERGEVLLQHRSDNGLWGIPGGVLDPGEDPAVGIIREVREETSTGAPHRRVWRAGSYRVISQWGLGLGNQHLLCLSCKWRGAQN